MTHLVVSDDVDPSQIPVSRARNVVKQQWFWESIQIEAKADEKLYLTKVRLGQPSLGFLIPVYIPNTWVRLARAY